MWPFLHEEKLIKGCIDKDSLCGMLRILFFDIAGLKSIRTNSTKTLASNLMVFSHCFI